MFRNWRTYILLIPALCLSGAIGYCVGFLVDARSALELHWTEYFKAMGPSLIAIFVALIAWQQWQLSKATLREKLFERRMQVFSQLRDVLSEAMRSGTLEQNELNRLRDTINAARFLFGSEINSWLDEMFQKAIILKHLTEVFNNHIDGDTAMETSQLDKKAEAFQFLVSQFEELFPKFEPYLKFDHRN